MGLKVPELKRRSDKSLPRKNEYLGDLEDFFIDNESSTSFHFFTSNGKVDDEVWKVLVSDKNIVPDNLEEEILGIVLLEDLISEIKYFSANNMIFKFVIFFDDINWSTDDGIVFLVEFKLIDNENLKFIINQYNKLEFEKYLLIKQNTEMVMNKQLIYSTTQLEGYLSDMCQSHLNPKGRAIFPGDVDLVLYSGENTNRIIEFKKHTQSGDGTIENQSFRKYWYKDSKKYSGIAFLAARLGLNHFVNIIYSTRNDELKKIKFEVIGMKNNELVLLNSTTREFNSLTDIKPFFEDFVGNSL